MINNYLKNVHRQIIDGHLLDNVVKNVFSRKTNPF